MAERNNDDIAAALQGLNSGDDGSPPPQKPSPLFRPPAAKRSAAPARPAMPNVPTQSAPSPRPIPPASAPTRPGARPTLPGQTFTPAETVETHAPESSPEPDPPAFTPRPRAKKLSAKANLRRTMIPILLTLGTMMLIMALGRWIFDPDAPLANLPIWAPILLAATSIMLLGFAVLNMLMVRNEMSQRQSEG